MLLAPVEKSLVEVRAMPGHKQAPVRSPRFGRRLCHQIARSTSCYKARHSSNLTTPQSGSRAFPARRRYSKPCVLQFAGVRLVDQT